MARMPDIVVRVKVVGTAGLVILSEADAEIALKALQWANRQQNFPGAGTVSAATEKHLIEALKLQQELPPYKDAPPEQEFWDDRTIPDSDPGKPASLDYVQGVRDALDVIAKGLKRNGNVDPEDIYQARKRFYGGDA